MATKTNGVPRAVHRDGWFFTSLCPGPSRLSFTGVCQHGGWLLTATVDAPTSALRPLHEVLWECFMAPQEPVNLDDVLGWCELSGLPILWAFQRERLVSPFDPKYHGQRTVTEPYEERPTIVRELIAALEALDLDAPVYVCKDDGYLTPDVWVLGEDVIVDGRSPYERRA